VWFNFLCVLNSQSQPYEMQIQKCIWSGSRIMFCIISVSLFVQIIESWFCIDINYICTGIHFVDLQLPLLLQWHSLNFLKKKLQITVNRLSIFLKSVVWFMRAATVIFSCVNILNITFCVSVYTDRMRNILDFRVICNN